jgi:hypothetical protein
MAKMANLTEKPNVPLQPTGMNISASREHSGRADQRSR